MYILFWGSAVHSLRMALNVHMSPSAVLNAHVRTNVYQCACVYVDYVYTPLPILNVHMCMYYTLAALAALAALAV